MQPASEFGPNPIDVHVGRRLANRRIELGLNQSDLARSVELTFQQIQKYEKGANRVSASKLWVMAEFLEVPVEYFFDGLRSAAPAHSMPASSQHKASKYSIEVGRLLPELPLARQKIIAELVRTLADDDRQTFDTDEAA